MSRWKDFTDMLVRKLKIRRGQAAFATRYVPATAALVLATFAPTVSATSPLVVTPTTRALVITERVPTVTATVDIPQLVTPPTAALTIIKFAPTITATSHQEVIVPKRTVVLTTFAPNLSGSYTVTPTTGVLTVTRYAPTVSAPGHVVLIPATKVLTITEFAPTVTSANHIVVTPTTKVLTTARFAPTVSNHQLVTPGKRTLVLTKYAPAVQAAQTAPAFYIAPSTANPPGNDANLGTIGSPWRTIARFVSQATAGETLYCRGGTYTGQPEFTTAGHSGSSGNPITVRNYPGEVPNFVSMATYLEGGTSYWVLDGLTISGSISGSSAHIWVGNGRSTPGATNTHHMTIRNCSITKGGGAVTAHGIYLSHKVDSPTIENNIIVGVNPSLPEDRCAAIHVHHDPLPTNMLVQRNILRRWPKGIVLFSESAAEVATGSFLHNTFQNNDFHFDARHHAAILVRDNVGDNSISFDLYDPLDSANTTQDHNYWSQTLTAAGKLTAGSPAINGALDGSDAGALDYP